MGWDGYDKNTSKAEIISHATAKWTSFKDGGQIVSDISIDSAKVKDGIWQVRERKAGDKSIRYITITLIQKEGGKYYTKTITEAEGPYYYDCPVRFFKKVKEGANKEWRDGVIKTQTDASRKTLRWNKIRKMIKRGDKVIFAENVKLDNGTFNFFDKRSLYVIANGKSYRCTAKHIDVDKTLLELRKNV